MEFKNKEEMLNTIKNNMEFLDSGSQGMCYLDRNTNKVYKIFYSTIDDYDIKYSKEEILRFNNIKNNTFVWPIDSIQAADETVGYINNYCNCKALYKINPLRINLDKFYNAILKVKKDIKVLSNQGVLTYDLMYNIMYRQEFKIIDFMEFSYSNKDPQTLEKINNNNFNYELYYFLVESYFDDFINSYPILKNMYKNKDGDILDFINIFKKYLAEYLGYDIKILGSAKKCMNKTKQKDLIYQRLY